MGGGRSAPECPIRCPELSARISERRPEFNGGGRWRESDLRAKPAGLALKTLEHDPEKWTPVFRKDHAQTKR